MSSISLFFIIHYCRVRIINYVEQNGKDKSYGFYLFGIYVRWINLLEKKTIYRKSFFFFLINKISAYFFEWLLLIVNYLYIFVRVIVNHFENFELWDDVGLSWSNFKTSQHMADTEIKCQKCP